MKNIILQINPDTTPFLTWGHTVALIYGFAIVLVVGFISYAFYGAYKALSTELINKYSGNRQRSS